MNQNIKFQRALMLADRKQYEKAEAVLREVVELDAASVVGCQALVALGELVSFHDADEAQTILEQALTNMAAHPDEPVLDWDRNRVDELLAELAEA